MSPAPALVVIDVQEGLDEPRFGRRSNPDAESNIARLLQAWRGRGWPVVHVQHLSTDPESPLRPELPGCRIKAEAAPIPGEPLFQKRVNCAFIGTGLESHLRGEGIESLVLAGLTADHCVSSTARIASDLGFHTRVVFDATAAFGKVAHDGRTFTPEEVHAVALLNLQDEFAGIVTTGEVMRSIEAGTGG